MARRTSAVVTETKPVGQALPLANAAGRNARPTSAPLSRATARQAINRVSAKKGRGVARPGNAARPASVPADMQLVIQPAARDRWSSATLLNLTPDRVKMIMQSVVGGSFVGQWELFELMEDTWPRLKKNLNELKHNVQKVDMIANAYGSDKKPSALALKKQEVLEAAMESTLPRIEADENSWEDAIYDSLDAVGKGISVQEILWEPRDTPSGTMILPKAFQWVYPRHYGYWVDQPDLLLSVSGFGGDWAPFPEDKFIIGTFKTKTGHLLKSPLLRALATIWIGANFSYDWALNLAQMFGLPIRWATYDPTNPNLLNDICDMLENMGSAGWGAFPIGTTLELKEAVGNAAQNPQGFLMEMADVACDILILGQTLTTTQGARGALALGRVHQDVRAEVIEHAASWVAKTYNYQFVPALMRLNFGHNEEDPYLTPDIEGQRDALAMAQRDQIIVGNMQVQVKKQWFYQRHDIPMPEADDEILVVPKMAAPKVGGGGGNGSGDSSGGGDSSGDSSSAKFVQAKSANEKLIDNVLEDLTGVEAKWLGGVKPFFASLLTHAQNDNVTDAELIRTIEEAGRIMPELFPRLKTQELANELQMAMTAALVNGVTRGVMQRRQAGMPALQQEAA